MGFETNIFNIVLLVFVGLVVAFAMVFFYYYKRHVYHTKHVAPRVKDWVFLEIQMPKDSSDEKDKQKSDEEKKKMIGVAEQLFTTLSESGHNKGWLLGKDYYSFEIACTNKKISFFINCPKHLQELVEKQLQSKYPFVFVEQILVYVSFL